MEINKTYPLFLQGYVRFFYTVRASESPYIFKSGHGVAQRRLPDGTLDVVFNLGGEVELSRDGLHFDTMPSATITGLYPNRSFVKYNGNVHLVGAVFQPGSAHLFINEILTQFRAVTIDAALVFGSNVYQLLEQLHFTSGDREKHLLMESFLLAYQKGNKEQDNFNRISAAVKQVHYFKGAVDMNYLREYCLMSERNFRRRFNEYVGMSPKQYAGIIRVKEFTKVYETSKSSYQEHFEKSGYTDHAHFNKDFQKIIGLNPSTFFGNIHAMDSHFLHLI